MKLIGFLSFVFAIGLASVGFKAGAAGWDNNLTRRCVSTTGHDGDLNYFQDTTGCPEPGSPPPNRWLVGVQTENAEGGQSCVGVNNRSELINSGGSNGPIVLNWLAHQSDIGPNWSVNMVVDQYYNAVPCLGANVWTWYVFQDNTGAGGGPFPNANIVASSHVINYSQYVRSSNDGSRMIAMATFFWEGKAHTIEIDLASINQTYTSSTPGLLVSKRLPDGAEYIVMDGAYWGVTTTPGVDTFVYIPWYRLVQSAVENGWFTGAPDLSQAPTGAVGLAIEVRNKALANVWFTNFRVGP